MYTFLHLSQSREELVAIAEPVRKPSLLEKVLEAGLVGPPALASVNVPRGSGNISYARLCIRFHNITTLAACNIWTPMNAGEATHFLPSFLDLDRHFRQRVPPFVRTGTRRGSRWVPLWLS